MPVQRERTNVRSQVHRGDELYIDNRKDVLESTDVEYHQLGSLITKAQKKKKVTNPLDQTSLTYIFFGALNPNSKPELVD